VRLTSLSRSLAYLWLLISATVPPKRSDWGELHIVSDARYIKRSQNGLILCCRGAEQSSPPSATIVLNNFKKSKRYGRYTEELPDPVAAAVAESVHAFPRDYLFVNKAGVLHTSFSKWAIRTFAKYVGKPITLNGLRKSWVSNVHDATVEQQMGLAPKMLHDWATQRVNYARVVER
jgi:hypothetical protein